MHHHERRRGGEFDGEVPVGYRVERVGADRIEPELARDLHPVDREARAGERCASERQPVHARAAVAKPFEIAREHRLVREQMMAEDDRLCHLQMRVAGHDGVGVPQREVDERSPQREKLVLQRIDRPPQPEPQVRGDLVVARACRVQPLACVADERREAPLDVEVDVLEIARPGELPARYLAANCLHSALDRCAIDRCQDPDGSEHSRVRQRAGDVDLGETTIEIHRCGVPLDEVGDGLAEAAGPCPCGGSGIGRLGVGHGELIGLSPDRGRSGANNHVRERANRRSASGARSGCACLARAGCRQYNNR